MSTAIIVVGANGRMGRTISHLAATEPGYSLAGMVDSKEHLGKLAGAACPVADTLAALLPQAPGAVVIDFTAPVVSPNSAKAVAAAGSALVIGTTGFSDAERAELEALAQRAPIFWSSNMSIGVNVLRKVLPELARALGEPYDIEIVELHGADPGRRPGPGARLEAGGCALLLAGRHYRGAAQGADRHPGRARRGRGGRAHRVLHGAW